MDVYRLRPSTVGRLALCPGSHRLCSGLETAGSEDADRGTLLHSTVAQAISAGLESVDMEDEHDAYVVNRCLAFWKELRNRHGEPQSMIVEHPVGRAIRGTVDLIALFNDRPRIIDWKFHRGPLPEVLVTAQLLSYGLGAIEDFAVPPIEVIAYQPEGDWRYVIEIGSEDEVSGKLNDLIRFAEDNPEDFRPSEEACQYCPAAVGRCKAVLGASEGVQALVKAKDLSPVPTSTLEEAYDLAKALDSALKRIKAELKERVLAGESKRYEVVVRRGRQQISNPIEAAKKLSGTLSPAEMLGAMSVNVTKLGDLYHAKIGGGRKTAREEMEQALGETLSRGAPIEVLQRKRGSK